MVTSGIIIKMERLCSSSPRAFTAKLAIREATALPAARRRKSKMNVIITTPGPKLQPGRLDALEGKLGLTLPLDFRKFLLNTNGGTPTPDHYRIEGSLDTPFSDVQTIFGVDTVAEHDDLELVYQDYLDRVPHGFLPIGHSSTNDLLCLSLRTQDYGTVYFWDSWADGAPEPSKRSGYSNLNYVAEDFSSFLLGLRSYETLAND
jgi:hypothetical protein